MDAKTAIKKQFMKEYTHKDFARITVKGLCAGAPVARTTFYSHYNNTDDVMKEIENELIGGLTRIADTMSGGDYPAMEFTPFLDEIQDYIKKNWDNFYAFFSLISEIIGSATIGAYTWWMQHPEEVSTKDMKPLIGKILTALTQLL